ncbi:Eukaryotic translation initiation factor isoform 4G-1 [Diplonema papillatum]|nr:Eukaryotic translation initiation factor isoform 4G-1 [Diplonema papillatum]
MPAAPASPDPPPAEPKAWLAGDGAAAAAAAPGNTMAAALVRYINAQHRQRCDSVAVQTDRPPQPPAADEAGSRFRPKTPGELAALDRHTRSTVAALNKAGSHSKLDGLASGLCETSGLFESDDLLGKTSELLCTRAILEPTNRETYARFARILADLEATKRDAGCAKPDGFRAHLAENVRQLYARHGRVPEAEWRRERLRNKCATAAFIGELHKCDLVPQRMVLTVLGDFLKCRSEGSDLDQPYPEDDDVQAACHLIPIVGELLDSVETSRNHLDTFFARIELLAGYSRYSHRTRQVLENTIDLRNTGWVVDDSQPAAPEEEDVASRHDTPSIMHERDALLRENKEMKEIVDCLTEVNQSRLESMREVVNGLQSALDEMQTENESLRISADEHKTKAESLRASVEEFKQKNEALETKLRSLEQQSNKAEEEDQCCICLDVLGENVTGFAGRVACKHTVHIECGRSLTENGHRKCPMCRVAFDRLAVDPPPSMPLPPSHPNNRGMLRMVSGPGRGAVLSRRPTAEPEFRVPVPYWWDEPFNLVAPRVFHHQPYPDDAEIY